MNWRRTIRNTSIHRHRRRNRSDFQLLVITNWASSTSLHPLRLLATRPPLPASASAASSELQTIIAQQAPYTGQNVHTTANMCRTVFWKSRHCGHCWLSLEKPCAEGMNLLTCPDFSEEQPRGCAEMPRYGFCVGSHRHSDIAPLTVFRLLQLPGSLGCTG